LPRNHCLQQKSYKSSHYTRKTIEAHKIQNYSKSKHFNELRRRRSWHKLGEHKRKKVKILLLQVSWTSYKGKKEVYNIIFLRKHHNTWLTEDFLKNMLVGYIIPNLFYCIFPIWTSLPTYQKQTTVQQTTYKEKPRKKEQQKKIGETKILITRRSKLVTATGAAYESILIAIRATLKPIFITLFTFF
jgi:hypothetical protein